MQPFTLTRSDFSEVQAQMLASARAYAGGKAKGQTRQAPGVKKPSAGKRMLWKLLVWFSLSVCFFALFRLLDDDGPGSRHALCILASVLATLALMGGVIVLYNRRLQESMVADDRWFLSPQTVDANEMGIDRTFKGGTMHLDWSAFLYRHENDTKVFLFIEPGHCLPVPKAALSAQAKELIAQRVPLQVGVARKKT